MKIIKGFQVTWIVPLLVGSMAAFATTFVRPGRTVSPSSISELGWMSGDWQTAPGTRAPIEEHWTKPAGGSMIGMGRTTVGAKTAEFEFLKIEERGGSIYYVASPNGQCPPTDFKLTRLSDFQAIFENPKHDFPKRIIYRKSSDGSLSATIDAGEGTKSQTFNYLSLPK